MQKCGQCDFTVFQKCPRIHTKRFKTNDINVMIIPSTELGICKRSVSKIDLSGRVFQNDQNVSDRALMKYIAVNDWNSKERR